MQPFNLDSGREKFWKREEILFGLLQKIHALCKSYLRVLGGRVGSWIRDTATINIPQPSFVWIEFGAEMDQSFYFLLF